MRTRALYRLDAFSRREKYLRRASSVAPLFLLSVSLVASMTLGVAHNRLQADNRPDPVLGIVRTALLPLQFATTHTVGSFGTVWSWVFGGRRLQQENARLREENARLRRENEYMKINAGETARLREALGFAEKVRPNWMPAEVVALRPSALFDTVQVTRGTRDGVRIGTIVRSPDGLVGQVSDVALASSQVTLLSDANSGVGAMVIRGGKVQGVGILEGRGRGKTPELMYLKLEDRILPGDTVVSSGFGGVVPKDIIIGRIIAVREDRSRFLKSATVAPAAPLHRVREVFLQK